MERIVDQLLQDFERGKMSRRQLTRTLAAVAASSAVGSTTVAAGPKGFRAVAVNHISYQVADCAKTRDFYADLFSMKLSHDDGKQCYLAFGDTFLIPRNHDSNAPRIDHIAYTIDNWDKNLVEAELKRRGLDPQPDNENSFHVKDPNGFDLQISGKEMKP
jgi:catechol 2,3-dioxygenase-like lactoylglutathione lyase family enzyme